MCGPLRYLGLCTSSHCSGPSAGHGWGVKEAAAAAQKGRAGREGTGGWRGQDTVRLLLQQPASLTLAAQRLLGHDEEEIGVGQSLRVEQPGGVTEKRGVEVRPAPTGPALSTPAPPPAITLRPGPSGPLPAPGAVSTVDDGVVGGVHRPEVVLRLFHDTAALTRLGVALGLRGVCEGQSASATALHPGAVWVHGSAPLCSAISPALPLGWESVEIQEGIWEGGALQRPYLPAWNQLW